MKWLNLSNNFNYSIMLSILKSDISENVSQINNSYKQLKLISESLKKGSLPTKLEKDISNLCDALEPLMDDYNYLSLINGSISSIWTQLDEDDKDTQLLLKKMQNNKLAGKKSLDKQEFDNYTGGSDSDWVPTGENSEEENDWEEDSFDDSESESIIDEESLGEFDTDEDEEGDMESQDDDDYNNDSQDDENDEDEDEDNSGEDEEVGSENDEDNNNPDDENKINSAKVVEKNINDEDNILGKNGNNLPFKKQKQVNVFSFPDEVKIVKEEKKPIPVAVSKMNSSNKDENRDKLDKK